LRNKAKGKGFKEVDPSKTRSRFVDKVDVCLEGIRRRNGVL
jgi:hypothetical protein